MTIYQRKSDELWIGVVDLGRDGTGKRIRRTVSAKSKRDCRTKLRNLQRALEDGLAVGVSNRTTVEQWVRYWLDTIAVENLTPRTHGTYTALVNSQIVPVVGQYRLGELTPAHVREMNARNKTKGYAGSTAASAHVVLKAALRAAVRERLIPYNPVDMVDKPLRDKNPRPTLTADQVRRFMHVSADAGDPMTARWAVAFLLGLRQGEALGMEYGRLLLDLPQGPHYDLAWQLAPVPMKHGCGEALDGVWPCGQRGAPSCPQTTYRARSDYKIRRLRGTLALTPPKTHASERIIPLLPPVVDAIREHRASAPASEFDLLFTDGRGFPIHPARDAKAWYAALERAGLPRVSHHSARHTTATLLLEAGVDLHVVGAILGHVDVETTGRYAHVRSHLAATALGHLNELLPTS